MRANSDDRLRRRGERIAHPVKRGLHRNRSVLDTNVVRLACVAGIKPNGAISDMRAVDVESVDFDVLGAAGWISEVSAEVECPIAGTRGKGRGLRCVVLNAN